MSDEASHLVVDSTKYGRAWRPASGRFPSDGLEELSVLVVVPSSNSDFLSVGVLAETAVSTCSRLGTEKSAVDDHRCLRE